MYHFRVDLGADAWPKKYEPSNEEDRLAIPDPEIGDAGEIENNSDTRMSASNRSTGPITTDVPSNMFAFLRAANAGNFEASIRLGMACLYGEGKDQEISLDYFPYPFLHQSRSLFNFLKA